MVENHYITPMKVSTERLEEAVKRLNAMDVENKKLLAEMEEVVRNAKIPKC